MKKVGMLLAGMVLSTAVIAAPSQQQASSGVLSSQKDRLSYALGFQTGRAFKTNDIKINPKTFMMGLKDSLSKNKGPMNEQQVMDTLKKFQQSSMRKREKAMQKIASKNLQMSKAFMAANKKKPGVKTLPDGLQYKVLVKGKGPIPKKTDVVVVDYEGKLTSGMVFDSSYKRGKPAKFPVSGVIKGWQQALTMMPQGSTWEIVIPPKLAYGTHGVPGAIGPNQALIFKVHLIKVQK